MTDALPNSIDLYRGPLYKYKSLSDETFAHTVEILREHRIFIPKPTQLNDDLECKPELVVGNFDNPNYRATVEAWVRRCVRHRPEQPTEEEIQHELAQLTVERLKEFAGQSSPEYHAAIDQQVRILSMAIAPDNDHLWQAYADGYSGVCIQMHLTPWLNAYRVKYCDEVPILDLSDDESFCALDMTALRKRLKWSYEGEARIILQEPALPYDPTLVEQKLAFDPHRIKAVVFGYRVEPPKLAKLQSILRGRGVPLYMAYGGVPHRTFEFQALGTS
ncbi:DUF2971 domain-containing protein [Burkholderia cepacia]|uniref:DUF2971 domain-containing protein n=1 Tax=Burkholderia cepacia TaxID=292 RepID=UPI001591C933|nr:DUF2971 domain-containing protein [Burkholderia cepacia]